MKFETSITETRQTIAKARQDGLSVGYVPTMGYFHDGHLSLIRTARESCGFVVVSIFVNPLQFGPKEDLAAYPRNIERDCSLAAQAGADLVFAPGEGEMYRPRFSTAVEVGRLGTVLCGASRPGHFRGVATVVVKLLNIVRPDVAFFGEKDAQQLIIIRRVVEDLDIPTTIKGIPTVREADGLAMSSRNVYLTPEERGAAPVIYRALLAAEDAIKRGERRTAEVLGVIGGVLQTEPLLKPDYFAAVGLHDLEERPTLQGEILLAIAARIGKARLIDNLPLDVSDTVKRIAI